MIPCKRFAGTPSNQIQDMQNPLEILQPLTMVYGPRVSLAARQWPVQHHAPFYCQIVSFYSYHRASWAFQNNMRITDLTELLLSPVSKNNLPQNQRTRTSRANQCSRDTSDLTPKEDSKSFEGNARTIRLSRRR
jgi:hypothetical protein